MISVVVYVRNTSVEKPSTHNPFTDSLMHIAHKKHTENHWFQSDWLSLSDFQVYQTDTVSTFEEYPVTCFADVGQISGIKTLKNKVLF